MQVITSGPTDKKTTYQSAYVATLAMTDRQARHHAVDSSPRHARHCQRMFARKINRLAKLLARHFPTAEIHFSGGCMCPMARKVCSQQIMSVSIWVLENNTILRAFVCSGIGQTVQTHIETTHYPHRHCAADLGVETLVNAYDGLTVVRAARQIIATPFQTFATENI